MTVISVFNINDKSRALDNSGDSRYETCDVKQGRRPDETWPLGRKINMRTLGVVSAKLNRAPDNRGDSRTSASRIISARRTRRYERFKKVLYGSVKKC